MNYRIDFTYAIVTEPPVGPLERYVIFSAENEGAARVRFEEDKQKIKRTLFTNAKLVYIVGPTNVSIVEEASVRQEAVRQ